MSSIGFCVVRHPAAPDRAAIGGYFEAVGEEGCARIAMVAMDRWQAYIASVRKHTDALIAFDKFHVALHLGAAVDQVRRSENRALRQQGDDQLVNTRYLWLTRRSNMTQRQRRAFTPCVRVPCEFGPTARWSYRCLVPLPGRRTVRSGPRWSRRIRTRIAHGIVTAKRGCS